MNVHFSVFLIKLKRTGHIILRTQNINNKRIFLVILSQKSMRKLQNEELGRITTEQFRRSEKSPFVIVLDNIRSESNVGSVFRTADAFLIESIYL